MSSPSSKQPLGPRCSGVGGKGGKAQVKPFTKESLERLENKTVQLVREYGFTPRRKLSVEDGSVLPGKFEPFPNKLYGRPLEEIDNFIYDETFCVVSKRFKKNYIHRFTATSAFFVFSPWNTFRRTCIFLSTNQYFDYVVMVTILINCVFLAMSDAVEWAEYIFLAIYTAEMIIKSIAKGFILHKYTYLRNPWNWLDFVVITSGYATMGMEMGNLAGLRTFRVLRALKTISILPGLKTIINALLHSFKQLAEVMTLTIFCLMVFALFALQVYMGELRNKCVRVVQIGDNGTAEEWFAWIKNETNWLTTDAGNPVICGNVTGARHCPVGYFCVQVGENPNFGYTSFDNFLWSMLTTFQLITLDYWENVYNMVLASCGPISVVFFTVVVFFGSFYLINLMLAVVALSYEEEAEITNEERKKDLTDHREDSTFSFDPSNINVKQLDRNNRKRVDSRKGVLLASYSRKKTRRRKKPKPATAGEGDEATSPPAVEGASPAPTEVSEKLQRSRSLTPSPRQTTSPLPQLPEVQRPQSLTVTPAVPMSLEPDTLHPVNALVPGLARRGQLLASRHPSSNASEGNNRESSLDDSGVVDDHEEGDVTSEEIPHVVQQPVTVALRSKEIRVIKCNGVSPSHVGATKKEHMYTLPADYLSHIVVLDDLPDRNCDKCTQCCMDYEGWLRFQSSLYNIVKDPLFDLLITLCIVLNTIFLAMEHHGMSESLKQALDIGNKVFTSIFTLECFLKLLALSKEYFDCGWNIFDLIIVSASILDLAFELVEGGLSVLRGLRLLRVLKLAQSWTTMKVLLSIIISTIGALGNLTFVLVIVIYIFAVIGMQLFSKDYTPDKFEPDPVPRWNFNDFFHSFMMIFRILCGEWIEPLWDCMRAEAEKGSGTCFAIFLPALVMGNFMVLNLFLALLLNSFNSEELKSKKEPGADVDDEETKEFKARLRHHYQVITKLWRRCWGIPDPPTPPPEALFIRCPPPPCTPPPTAPPRFRRRHYPVNQASSETLPLILPVATPPPPEILFQRCRPPPESLPGNPFIVQPPKAVMLLLDNCQEEVGEDSKLARSFDRLRSIVRRGRLGGREKNENERNMRLEEVAREVLSRHKADKNWTGVRETILGLPEHRRQEGMTIKQPPDKDDFPLETTTLPSEVIMRHATPIKQTEGRQYSASVQENLHKRAEDKRYSLIMQRSGAIDQQDGIQDLAPIPTLPEPTEPETEALIPDKKDIVVVPEGGAKRQERRFSIATTQQASSKDSAAEESIELDHLGKAETETMLPAGEQAAKRPWHALVSYVDELTVGGRKDSKGHYVDGLGSFPGFGNNKPVKIPQDCFHPRCYERCTCCQRLMTTEWGLKWTKVRSAVLSVVDTPVFEWFILVLIFASSITLCFEDIHLDSKPDLKRILYWTNMAFCALFSIEMVLKWIALGFWKYFTSFWTILDFIIVFVSVFSLLIEENENLKVLRSLRTLRALRPLRAISRWQGMRIVVNALMYAIPSIFNVLLVCLVFWLIFSIMGVQFFSGKFYKCVDQTGEPLPVEIISTHQECIDNRAKNYTWINSKISFDNVGTAYLALFQVATFEGWMEVMADAVDARGVDLQPQREANLYAYLYFVIFIVCGSFFTLNLFIGVIIDNFNMLKKKYEGGVLEMFLTPSQKHYYTAMKKLGRKKPQKVIKRPLNQFLAMFYDLSNSRRFEIAIFVLIFLNMLSMGVEHYGQPHAIYFVLEVSNAFFTTVFGLEAIVKIIGLRYHYFTVPWNLFDFILVLASILGILMEDIMIDLPVSPTLLRVVRVFRIGRILRLIKAAKGIRKLLFALVVSLPALFNIGALLALITFIYAIIGMSVFGHVIQQGALDDMVNFTTFGRSMQLLFRLMTSAGWNDVLEALMIEPPLCDPSFNNQPNGNCGHPLLAITYFTSFIIISYMIVINMYIAIILENFNQAHQEEEIGIVEDDLEMFYIRWSKFDPHATQFIRFTQLSDFIASLDPPLGIAKPNVVALVSFNLPIARGNKIHCLDILHSLVKYVLGHVEESEDFRKLQDQMDVKFKKQFPTRKELEIVSSTRIWKREDKAARLIQGTWREYVRLKRSEPLDLEDEMTQTSSPGGGWQSRLSAFLHVHRGSRCSSRKSSRASDASELSELGGAWLNLPLLFLSSTHPGGQTEELLDPGNGHVSIMVSEPSPEAGPSMREIDLDSHILSTADLPLRDSIAIGLRELRRKNAAGDVSILVTEPSPDSTKNSPNRSSPSDITSPQGAGDGPTVQPCSSESNLYSGIMDMHPSALTPGGGALSLLPMEPPSPVVTRSTESIPPPVERRVVNRSTESSPLPVERRAVRSTDNTPPPVERRVVRRPKEPNQATPPPVERRVMKRSPEASPHVPPPVERRVVHRSLGSNQSTPPPVERRVVNRSTESNQSTPPPVERHPAGLRPGGAVLSLLPADPPKPPPPEVPPRRARFRRSSDATIVHVLVHRESEEDVGS